MLNIGNFIYYEQFARRRLANCHGCITFSDVFNLTLNQIYLKRKIPFELSSTQITENGYTTDFEAELLQSSNESHIAVANGAKTFRSAAELRAALDAEEDDEKEKQI